MPLEEAADRVISWEAGASKQMSMRGMIARKSKMATELLSWICEGIFIHNSFNTESNPNGEEFSPIYYRR